MSSYQTKKTPGDTAWFTHDRFGMFIHWGLYAMPARHEWIKTRERMTDEAYDRYFRHFDPDLYDPKQWARLAKAAGMKYAVMTAKHHEGFALWPSEFGNHSVAQATVRTDIVAEFLRAFRAAGLQAGLYFSVLDLTAGIGRRSFPPAQRELVLGQITELLTNYGEIPYFIIDGWNAPWGGPSYRELPFEEVDALVKRLQPNCLLMNIGCTEGISGTDVVFFENGAGQELTPGFAGPGALCQKLTRTWFYRDDEKEPKSADWALGLMRQCFASHANFMLNLSPDPDGRIPAPLAARFAEIGARVSFPAPLTELPAGWLRR